jgi:predicted N-acetyltransferase YhbS
MDLKITTLKENESFFAKTLKLIEKSFGYSSEYSFKEDFYPLINKNNHQNCYIAVDNNENILGHLGVRLVHIKINNEVFPIAMLGGIATDEKSRGKGVFTALLKHVLERHTDVAFYLLWSDNQELYNKFDFYLCGLQLEFPFQSANSTLERTKFSKLNDVEKNQVKTIYNKESYPHLIRTTEDWANIEQMNSLDLYLKRNDNEIIGYAFKNKGADLAGVVHEYRGILIKELQAIGKVWSMRRVDREKEGFSTQYAYFMRPGNYKYFAHVVHELSGKKIEVLQIQDSQVLFKFNDNESVMDLSEFLVGIFGPNYFEELDETLQNIQVSGVDSI